MSNQIRVDEIFILNSRNRDYITGQSIHYHKLESVSGIDFAIRALWFSTVIFMLFISINAFWYLADYLGVLRNDGRALIATVTQKGECGEDGCAIEYALPIEDPTDQKTIARRIIGSEQVSRLFFNIIGVGSPLWLHYDLENHLAGEPLEFEARVVERTTWSLVIQTVLSIGVFSGLLTWAIVTEQEFVQIRLDSHPELERRPIVIPGRVLRTEGTRDIDDNLQVRIFYRAVHPEQKYNILGFTTFTRPDLYEEDLPAPGIPLAIAFRNRHRHQVL
ncbi:MAG: hypothetical protein ACOYL5_17645 [Phototrophicaceae bacterium]